MFNVLSTPRPFLQSCSFLGVPQLTWLFWLRCKSLYLLLLTLLRFLQPIPPVCQALVAEQFCHQCINCSSPVLGNFLRTISTTFSRLLIKSLSSVGPRTDLWATDNQLPVELHPDDLCTLNLAVQPIFCPAYSLPNQTMDGSSLPQPSHHRRQSCLTGKNCPS